ncbi:hypothetical protein HDU78_002981 [Chytriomyces hyalinus]|nr:hypothetical protein HDU78_002981 [Chytriomyces hyalinus]
MISHRKDLVFTTCNGVSFEAHCSVLTTKSPSFAEALSGVTPPTHDHPFRITVPAPITPAAVSYFLQCLYSRDPASLLDSSTPPTILFIHALSQLCGVLSLSSQTLSIIQTTFHQVGFMDLKDQVLVPLKTLSSAGIHCGDLIPCIRDIFAKRGLLTLLLEEDAVFLSTTSFVGMNNAGLISSDAPSLDSIPKREMATPLPRAVRHVMADVQNRIGQYRTYERESRAFPTPSTATSAASSYSTASFAVERKRGSGATDSVEADGFKCNKLGQ